MSAMLTIRNDGPHDAIIVFGGNPNDPHASARRLGPGQEIRIAANVPISFGAAKPLTPEELAMHHGIPIDQIPKHDLQTGRFAEE